MTPYPFPPWSKNILAPDEDWRRAADAPLVDVTCDLFTSDVVIYEGGPGLGLTARQSVFNFIDRSPNHWWLRTQQPGRVEKGWGPEVWSNMNQGEWHGKFRPNVTLFVPAQTQAELDRLAPELLKCSHLCNLGLDLRWPKERMFIENYLPCGKSRCPHCTYHGDDEPGTKTQCEGAGCGLIVTLPPEPSVSTVRLAPWEGEPCADCGTYRNSVKFGAWDSPPDCKNYRPAYTAHLASQCQAAGITITDLNPGERT